MLNPPQQWQAGSIYICWQTCLFLGWSARHFIKATSIPADGNRGVGPCASLSAPRHCSEMTSGCHIQFWINRQHLLNEVCVEVDGRAAARCRLSGASSACISNWFTHKLFTPTSAAKICRCAGSAERISTLSVLFCYCWPKKKVVLLPLVWPSCCLALSHVHVPVRGACVSTTRRSSKVRRRWHICRFSSRAAGVQVDPFIHCIMAQWIHSLIQLQEG